MMFGKLTFPVCFPGICLIVLAACSEATKANEEPGDATIAEVYVVPATVEEVDWKRLLTESDPVEVCTRELTVMVDREVGEGFVAPEFESDVCQCLADTYTQKLEEVAPGQSQIHNLALQITMNFEVIPVVFNEQRYPGGTEAFLTYLTEKGKEEIDVSIDELMSVIESVSDIFAEIKTAELGHDLIEGIPACEATLSESHRTLGDGTVVPTVEEFSHLLDIRALSRDPGLDLHFMDNILVAAATPEDLCRQVLSEIVQPRSGNQDSDIGSMISDRGCAAYFAATEAQFGNLDREDRALMRRVATLVFYLNESKKSARSESGRAFLVERADGLGVSADKLSRLFDATMAVSAESWEKAAEMLAEPGTAR